MRSSGERGSLVIGFVLLCCLEREDVRWNVDSQVQGNLLQPGDNVDEVKDEASSVLVPCTDWVLERLERESAAVKRCLRSGMWDLLFSVEWLGITVR